ncbi:YheU family protein [Actinobacillus equuli subsp. equuli]|uniref:YheU family protein n=1 Tax=Actinobacillus equuli TaxID=718 RepID=UPI0024189E62|nr:YheU family protein [Actinobacillus equuli]MDG4952895.1 YheU family protein [Actinobacillus equuli subsp. equuli]WGE58539.1 YheU family protein [Actinobacillus equuli subsp. haemolyticus]WGE60874.1 YheU family protein [Actinobacillus equuli subsp. haemolyticus]WGE64698.1 YheU family protein [Actinobacillus equuli subsp. equuli]
MIIPWQELEPATLNNVLDSFILREGTDYGEKELSLEEKRERLLTQLKADKVVIVWSELHQSLDIKDKKSFLG